jgi:hypothetical protein
MAKANAKKKKLFPLPEAIDGAKWDVRESASVAQTDTKGRAMSVPFADTDAAEFLRSHETAHARITPKVHAHVAAKRAGITMEAMQVCEDVRVNAFLRDRNIATHGALGPQEHADMLVTALREAPRKLGGLLVSCLNTKDYDKVASAIDRLVDPGIAEGVKDCAEAIRETFKARKERLVEECPLYRKSATPLSAPRGFKDLTVPLARMFDMLFPEDGDFQPGDASLTGYYEAHFSDRTGKWGRLNNPVRAMLSMPRRSRGQGGKSWRDEGAVPVAPYRLIIDGRIFCRRKKQKGGTVLIDSSGSMSFSADDLEKIIAAAPGATVAAYGGNFDEGDLYIVAERGRMASSKELKCLNIGGGNIVDGPALQWLAKMPAPRVWVSDGYVTGIGDEAAANLQRDAQNICRLASIKRVDKATAVVDALKEDDK